jgi:hypothetical protein
MQVEYVVQGHLKTQGTKTWATNVRNQSMVYLTKIFIIDFSKCPKGCLQSSKIKHNIQNIFRIKKVDSVWIYCSLRKIQIKNNNDGWYSSLFLVKFLWKKIIKYEKIGFWVFQENFLFIWNLQICSGLVSILRYLEGRFSCKIFFGINPNDN